MKIPYEIVKDLLPLYVDEVCSEKVKQIVEWYLAECEGYRRGVDLMKKELPSLNRAQNSNVRGKKKETKSEI